MMYYLKKLSFLAHWRFPKAEADEIVADYREFFDDATAADEDLAQRFGSPRQAPANIQTTRAYSVWLAVYAVLLVCLLGGLLPLFLGDIYMPTVFFLFAVGLALSKLWFSFSDRTYKATDIPVEKMKNKHLIMLIVLFFLLVLVNAFSLGLMMAPERLIFFNIAPMYYGRLCVFILQIAAVIAALLSGIGLVIARVYDRRWSAIYTLGLTVLVICCYILSILTHMDLDSYMSNWRIDFLCREALIAVTGIAVTGVSLC